MRTSLPPHPHLRAYRENLVVEARSRSQLRQVRARLWTSHRKRMGELLQHRLRQALLTALRRLRGHHAPSRGYNRRHARYECATCLRPFDRKDTLSRHMQIHERRTQPRTRRKACMSCCQSKTRCDGVRPECASCLRRGLACIYENRNPSRSQEQLQAQTNNAALKAQTHRGSNQANNQQHQRGLRETAESSPGISDQHLLESNSDNMILPPNANEQPQSQWQALPGFFDSDTSPYDQTLLYPTFNDMDFNSNLHWILDQNNAEGSFVGADMTVLTTGFTPKASQVQLTPRDQVSTSLVGQSDLEPHNVPAQGYENGHHADSLGGMISPEPQKPPHSTEPWRSETPAPPQHHISLPELGSESSTQQRIPKYFALTSITEHTRDALRKCLFLPLGRNPLQSLNLDHFPSKEKLDHCVDFYFAHFHPTAPVIHQPTFDPGKDLVVTLAMISIGSCYTDLANARSFAICLSELTGRLLTYMAQHDRRFVRTPSYLVAQILQGIHGYCSGSERLFELSESSRGTLVHNAKCMGLFRYETKEPDLTTLSLHSSWRTWVDAERLRRLGWAVYKYDGSVAYLHNNRPCLSVGDINLRLPASEEYWDAESAQAWAALHPWSQFRVERSPRLRGIIRTLFDGTPNPVDKIVDEEHAFIIVLTLLRMLWTLKEIRSSPINDLVTPPIFDDGRQTLLKAVDSMAVPLGSLAKTHTGVELSRSVHRMLLVHIAHVYGAGDLMNWLYPYLRYGPEAENANRRMKQWALEDSQRTRDLAYHCAQILGLLRHYPHNMPLEPFMLFHAGVVLSCVASLLPIHDDRIQDPILQLDELDLGDGDVTDRQMGWVVSGTDACPSLIGVPVLCCTTGRRAVLEQTAALLKRRKAWGMARNLTKVVLSLQSRTDEPNLQDADGSIPAFSSSDLYPED